METVWKYPKDIYAAAINWAGRYPSGATSLGAILATVKNSVGTDVTASMLVSVTTQGDYSIIYLQGGAAGETFTITVSQTFNTGRVLYEFVTLAVRDPLTETQKGFFKYPLDIFDFTLEWLGRLPLRATQLSTLTVKIYDDAEVDVSDEFLLNSQVLGTISIEQLYGGTAGEVYTLEAAQAFDDGSLLHDYSTMTVRAPAA